MEGDSSSSVTSATFDAQNGNLQTAALLATRRAVALPTDVNFHRSMDQGLARDLDAFSNRVLNMTNRILNLVSTIDLTKEKGKAKAILGGEDDVVDHFHSTVVDTMDQLLEKTDICLDEFMGRNKAPAIAINLHANTSARPRQPQVLAKSRNEPLVQHASHLTKPQLSFTRKPDSSQTPWYPALSHKYNAKIPLGHIYHDSGAEDSTSDGSSSILANHPYRYEITHITYPARMFDPCTPVTPPPLEDTQATWVATPAGLQEMLDHLRQAREIAVDLEHHSYRSYHGFLCLMQISDRQQDWVIDLLAVRDELEALNEVFTNPEIVKVFHGADSDIVWLQQDFNLYIVNLFDTFHASKLLEFPRHGLANLLEMYCDLVPDKRYQLADWRIRPLPEDMLFYARSDTHFLLYIYDNLRNALIDRSQSRMGSPSEEAGGSDSTPQSRSLALLNEALARSAETSLRVYSKEPYDATDGTGTGGWDTLAKKWNKGALMASSLGFGIGAMQREVYKAVHKWRDDVAREEDESTRYVLQNHFLFQLAEQAPADMPALLNVFKSSVPPVVKRRLKELFNAIRNAVERGMKLVNGNITTEILAEGHRTGDVKVGGKVDETKSKNVVMLDVEMGELERDSTAAKGSGEKGVCASANENTHRFQHEVAVNLWGGDLNGADKAKLSTSQSVLFSTSSGRSQKEHTAPSSSVASAKSVLFGQTKKANAAATEKLDVTQRRSLVPSSSVKLSALHAQEPRFQALVAKINESLVIAPSIPHIIPIAPKESSASTSALDHNTAVRSLTEDRTVGGGDGGTGMEVEVPFVAASQRATKRTNEELEVDTIVVVGQARQKRKRERERNRKSTTPTTANDPPIASGSRENTEVDMEANDTESQAQVPFDFSAVPNILDDSLDGEVEGASHKKKKQKNDRSKKGAFFYGDFPAPPKAHSELKSGNQAFSFK